MTDTPTDEGKNNPNPEENLIDDNDDLSEDNDPIIAEMRAAEAEIEAQEKAKAEGGEADLEPETPENQEPGKEKQNTQKAGGDKGQGPMVPKPRFDEVLSERDLLRDQVGYLRGLVDAKATSGTPAPAAEGGKQAEPGTDKNDQQGASTVDEITAAIEEAEQKKLELAEKYDEGEISTRDWKAAELAIDKEIRALSDKRIEQVREASRNDTQAVLNAAKTADWLNEQALAIQAKHPNVAVIDATPEHIKAGIWQQIDAEAAQNLANRGIDARLAQQDPRVKLAVMQEKARLTDRYTPESLRAFLPADFKAPQSQQPTPGQTEPGQKTPSQTAIERGRKIDLANSQPPTIADMGTGLDSGELTEADIEAMTEDQMADLLQKAPNLVKRVMGNSATG